METITIALCTSDYLLFFFSKFTVEDSFILFAVKTFKSNMNDQVTQENTILLVESGKTGNVRISTTKYYCVRTFHVKGV